MLFTFPSRYYPLSVAKGVSPWRVVPPASHRIPRVPWYSGSRPAFVSVAYGAFTSSGSPFQVFRLETPLCCRSATPGEFPLPVWALPRSLAATGGISFDSFSSGYLDVSVPRVPLPTFVRMTVHYHRRVPPFGYPRLYVCLRLPAAFRSLLRPSSALCA